MGTGRRRRLGALPPNTGDTVGVETRLSPEEWEGALAATDGPQLVVAGPGAGKSEFLVRRAVHLVEAMRVPPHALLVLTFSRRGAADLRARVERRLHTAAGVLDISTFHSLAARILEAHGPETHGWDEPPALLTGPEQVSLVAELLGREDPTAWPVGFRDLLGSPSFADEVTDFILRATERTMTAAELAEAAAGRSDWSSLPGFLTRYRAALHDRHRIDYGSLVTTATATLTDPTVAAAVRGRVSHVLVDEYQDTTPAQAALLEALVGPGGNLTVAADPYQSVYSFRGADLTNVDRFPDLFRGPDGAPARRWVLTRSFRVPANILGAAERLTAGDLPGSAGPVEAARPGGRVDTHVFDQRTHEADWIAAEIHRLHLVERIPLGRIAVLVRTSRRILPELSRSLDRRGLPHNRPGGRLVDHPAIRALSDVARLATADRTSLPEAEQRRAARRLLLSPLVGLPLGAERESLRERVRSGRPWADIVSAFDVPVEGLGPLLADPRWASGRPASEGFWHAWSSLPALGALALADPGWRSALTSGSQVLARLGERDRRMSLVEWLDHAERDDFEANPLLGHDPPGADHLVVTTLHQAKGLEYDVVFIADAVDGVLPDLRRNASILNTHLLPASRRDPDAAARFRVQEEMRLAYTAMTRASERVVWTATAAGIDEGEDRPSRFLDAVADGAPTVPQRSPTPITALEAEAHLRRILTDPAASAAERLGALAVVTDPTLPRLRPAGAFAGVREQGPSHGIIPVDAAFSPSQAMAYETCPRSYVLGRYLGIGDEATIHMVFGSLVHAAAEEADRRAITDGRDHATVEEALNALDRLFDPADFGGEPWSGHWRRRAEQAIVRLYRDAPNAGWRTAFVERHLDVELDGAHWRGRADRIDVGSGGVRVIDYKTSKYPPPLADAARSLQLALYVLATEADPEVSAHGRVVAAELWFPLAGNKGIGRRSFNLDNLPEARRRMTDIVTAIRAEEFPAVVSGTCTRCPVRILCDQWPEGREAFVP